MTRSVVVRPPDEPAHREPVIVINHETLKELGLDPDSVKARALVLLCQRYGLDPLLNEAAIVKNRPYITRDGMIKIAHRSGQLDGIVVEEQRQSEHGWSATVSVWRKDMTHPFTYRGGCGIDEPQAEQGNGAEMAIARAERRALRRAFSIPAYDDVDDPVIDTKDLAAPPRGETPAPAEGPSLPVPGRGGPSVEHRTVGQENGMLVCSCGHRDATAWGMSFHRKQQTGEEPPADLYDNLPEARGYR